MHNLIFDAQAAARECCKRVAPRLREAARAPMFVERKSDIADVVTALDREVQEQIRESLQAQFPDIAFLGEEQDNHDTVADREYCWVVDPIDGTENYTHRLPYYGTSVALLHHGIPVVGVIHFPEFGSTYTAIKGAGAQKNGDSITVRACSSLQEAVLGEFFSDRTHRGTQVLYPPCAAYRRFGSAVTSLAFLAEGAMDAVLLRCHLWDVAAASVIVQEAGGMMSIQQDDAKNPRSPLYCVASSPTIFPDVTTLVHEHYYSEFRV